MEDWSELMSIESRMVSMALALGFFFACLPFFLPLAKVAPADSFYELF